MTGRSDARLRAPRAVAPAVVGAIALALIADAHAGNGALPISNSPAAAGRGGTQVAIADDAHAVAVNPASSALLDGPRIDLGAAFYLTRSSFANARNNDRTELNFPSPAPAVAFGMPISLGESDALGFGIALHPIGGGKSEARFRTNAYPQGEWEKSDLLLYGLTAGFSIKAIPRVSLGLGVTAIYASLDQAGITGGGATSNGLVRNFANGQVTGGPFLVNGQPITWGSLLDSVRAPDTYASSRIEVENATGFGASAILGATIEVTDWITVGLSYRTPGWLSTLEGRAFLDASQSAAAGSPALDQIQTSFLANHLPDGGRLASKYDFSAKGLEVPQVAALGVALWPHDRLLLALDAKWIGWRSAFDEVRIELSRGNSRDLLEITQNQTGSSIRSRSFYRWHDQWVVALGGAFAATDWLVLRAGYNFSTNPVPSKTENPFVSATVEHHLTLGVGLRIENFSFDVSWVHAFVKSTSIRYSISSPEWTGMHHKADQEAFLIGGAYRF